MLPLAILGRIALLYSTCRYSYGGSTVAGMDISPSNHLLIMATNMVVVKVTHVTMHKLVITFRGKLNDKNKSMSIFF
jgi:hypothetical protein